MVAPNYSLKRQELAKKLGLGRKPRMVEPLPEQEPDTVPPPKRGRTRAKAP